MERAERIGKTVSAAGHASLVAWALFGGIFFRHDTPPPRSMSVSTVSASEFDAMMAAAPKAVTKAPVKPAAPPDVKTETPLPQAEAKPELPVAEPQAQTTPDAPPDVTALTPPATVAEDQAPDQPVVPVPDTPTLQVVTSRPKPKPAPVVAPVPNEAPAPDAQVSEEVAQAAEQVPAETPVEEKPPVEAAAPQETGQVLQTEENKDVTEISSSPRPKLRPSKPKPAEQQVAAAEPAPAAVPDKPTDEAAVAAALEQAMAGEASDTPAAGAGTAANGPPLTFGEKDALRADVQRCWNQGAISTDATRVVVTVRVQMAADGRPAGMEMLSATGGDDTATMIAYRTARSAIQRCAGNGYRLPAEKYSQWKVIDMVFNNKGAVR